jgi:hypothetical protein
MFTLKQVITAIHASGWKGCLAITGGGTQVIGELLHLGGGSATILDASVPYASPAFQDYIQSAPDKYVSEESARQLAMAAYQRARRFAPPEHDKDRLFGLGATCSLAKDNEREGRKHLVCVGWQTRTGTSVRTLELTPKRLFPWSEPPFAWKPVSFEQAAEVRAAEEWETCLYILGVICQQTTGMSAYVHPDEKQDSILPAPDWVELLHAPNTRPTSVPVLKESPKLVFPGSFSRLHDGHREVAQVASRMTGENIVFEISVTNVDKPPLDYIEIRERRKQFLPNQVVFTNTPRFYEKVALFPYATFVVGADTWERILNPKYLGHMGSVESLLRWFAAHGSKFLIFGRKMGEEFKTADPTEIAQINESYGKGFATIVPESLYHSTVAYSSTDIKRAEAAAKSS